MSSVAIECLSVTTTIPQANLHRQALDSDKSQGFVRVKFSQSAVLQLPESDVMVQASSDIIKLNGAILRLPLGLNRDQVASI